MPADVAIFEDTKLAREFFAKLQKKFRDVKDSKKEYGALLSAVVFGDVVSHFEHEEGSDGPWAQWSVAYEEHMEKIGKGGNQILQDTGKLKQAFMPTNIRSISGGFLWYNPAKTGGGFPYAFAHNEGGKQLPQRDFMWMSGPAMERLAEITLKFILDEG